MRRQLGFVGLTVGLLVLGALTVRHEVARIHAGRVLFAVEQRTEAALRQGQIPAGLVANNIASLRAIGPLDPAEVGIPVALAGQYLVLGRWDAAVAGYDTALRLEPRPEIYLNRGRALYGAGRREDALEDFHRAVLLAPLLSRVLPDEVRTVVVERVRAQTGWFS